MTGCASLSSGPVMTILTATQVMTRVAGSVVEEMMTSVQSLPAVVGPVYPTGGCVMVGWTVVTGMTRVPTVARRGIVLTAV